MNLCSKILAAMQGRTLATAESCTGGMIGAAITAIPGSSSVYKGGIISYTNQVKNGQLGVDNALLNSEGAVCAAVATAMAQGVRRTLNADVSIAVTGLAGPSGDDFGNPVGTVYVGYADDKIVIAQKCFFLGNRTEIREQATVFALEFLLKQLQ